MGDMFSDDRPRVSVLLPVYNDERFLGQAVESILTQTFADFEIVVVDDGSTDRTAQILADLADRDDRVRVLRNPANLGVAASLNRGIAVARGEYVARMDSDDIARPNRLAIQVGFLDARPDVAFVGGSHAFVDDAGRLWGHFTPKPSPTLLDVYRACHFSHPTVMIRTAVLRDVGGYTVSQNSARAEDYDLWCKVYWRGGIGHNLPDVLLDYREDVRGIRKRKLCYRMGHRRAMLGWSDTFGLGARGRLLAWRPVLGGLLPARLLLARRQRAFAFASGADPDQPTGRG